jgi:hypothetical protein
VKRKIALASLLSGLALLWARPGWAGQPVMEIDWSQTAPTSGHVVDDAVVVRAGQRGGAFPLTVVEGPAVGGDGYAIMGDVQYSGVVGHAYLEMWSVFPDGSRYFSRTLDDEGPLAAMTGTSDWRSFELPFYLQGAVPPDRLEITWCFRAPVRSGWDPSRWSPSRQFRVPDGGLTGRPVCSAASPEAGSGCLERRLGYWSHGVGPAGSSSEPRSPSESSAQGW